MARQPSYRPLQPSPFFADGRSARPLVAGVVARGQPEVGSPLVTGRKPATPGESSTGAGPVPDDPANYVNAFPFRITAEDLRRGQERFTIYCAPCHDPAGTGHGKIVERGYVQPPSYHTDLSRGFARWGKDVPLRDVPVGYFFEVMSRGYGAMPDYAEQLRPADRWRVAAYIRTLQLSQNAPLSDLPPDVQAEARKALEKSP